jgi:RHS repeat-associated protein
LVIFYKKISLIYEQEDVKYLEYIYVAGKHIARVDGSLTNTENKTYFYHTDHLGSAVLVTNGSGETVWSTEYRPFGRTTMKEGILDKAAKFTGKGLDEDTGLYYYNARWYDQEIGRFISEDSAKDGANWYTYVNNNPLINE